MTSEYAIREICGMSQAKVDKYKEYKRNKAKILKREKMIRRLEYVLALVVAAVFVIWFCFSVFNKVETAKAPDEVVSQEINLDDYIDYVGNLQTSFS